MIKNGWYLCPRCGRIKLARVTAKARCEGVLLWCKQCRREVEVKLPLKKQNNM